MTHAVSFVEYRVLIHKPLKMSVEGKVLISNSVKSEPNSKIVLPVYQGPDGFES